MVTFTGRQARLEQQDARENELTAIQQRSFLCPRRVEKASNYLLAQSESGSDAYYGVHLFQAAGSRKSSNAAGAITCLWLDEDEGHFPAIGPEPTAIVYSSATRRHLYWQLTRPLSAEWVVGVNRRIAHWAGGDSGKAGLATVLRVPGTNNFKRHPQVDPVTLEITGVPAWEPEVFEQAIPPVPEPPESTPRQGARCGAPVDYDGPEIGILEFLQERGVEIRDLGGVSDSMGEKYSIVCPWVDEHSGGDRTGTYAGKRAAGGLWFACRHDHCQGRAWEDFKRKTHPFTPLRVVPRGVRCGLEVIVDG